jgi:hypothetical protein
MYNHRKQSIAAQRYAERKEREDKAPRLRDEVPSLTRLDLAIEERAPAETVSRPRHVRRIVVERAPALFLVPCGDPRCEEGGHDVTVDVMRALRSGRSKFEGQDECHGSVGPVRCARILCFEATAEYEDSSPHAGAPS